MNITLLRRLSFVFVLLCATSLLCHAGSAVPAAAADAPASAASAAHDDFNDEPESADRQGRLDRRNRLGGARRRSRDHDDGDIVNIGHASHLPSGQRAESVVSILGSSLSEGEAQNVVSVLGDTRVLGPLGESAVAVLGNVYIDSKVDGDVVAVLGNVELGPNAEVGGDVVAVFGVVNRDPAAIVHGSMQRVFSIDFGGVGWLQTWIQRCLLYGRPLAFADGLGWAWTLALGFLAFYVCLALCFRDGLDRCVRTLEAEPGATALAALLGMLLTPVLLVLLCVTVIGIAAVPFVVAALFCASLFGKAVMLAWVGGRVAGGRTGPAAHPALAVLIGGAIVLVLYCIPVLGFLVYKLLGFFGFGAVVYTLVLMARARKAANGSAVGASSAPSTSIAGGEPSDPGTAAPAAPGVASPLISAAMPRAGFWIRMAALLLDIILVGFVSSVPFHHAFGNFHLVLLATYGAVMWKLKGATVGGIVFDLHVVRLDGRPVDWETAIVRALGCFLSLAVVGLGFIWIAFDQGSQAWHDKIAGTVVVRVKKGVPLV
ncbi:MAG TPA: RDD family protein [Steroidobacteraceae bacterium]|nr:RDD family protein [Steroidobacteraceae bacterium]